MMDLEQATLANTLVQRVAMHDVDTAAHLEATAALARRIALAMNLPPPQVGVVELAARLHDVGKVEIAHAVLYKSTPLTSPEWKQLRLHPDAGARIVMTIPQLAYLAPIVAAHHERMDGTGYPRRMKAKDIPLEARIVSVADSFHAMTTERPYCKARPPHEALAELRLNAGKQFDGDVVDAALGVFRYTAAPARKRAFG